MSGEGPASPGAVVADVLALPGHRERLRRLREHAGRFEPALAEEFCRSAAQALRRDPREAGRRAQLALAVAETVRDPRSRVLSLVERTKAAVLGGNTELALQSVDEASRSARELADEAVEAHVHLLRLQPLIALEQYAEARTSGESVLATFERLGETKGRVLSHMALADLAFRTDRPREALRHYGSVDRLMAPSAPAAARGAVALNRANALDACNRFRAAARHFDRARELFREAGSEHTVAQVDYNAAYGEMLRGRYQDSLRRYAACEEVFRRLDDRRHLAHIDLDRAEIHLHLNLAEDAQAFATSAAALFRELGLAKERAQAAQLGAAASELSGDLSAAAAGYEVAERLFEGLGLRERAFSCVVARAGIAERQGDTATARTLAAAARALLGDGMNPLSGASVDLLVARLDLVDGDEAAALAAAEAVLDTCRRIHAPWVRIEALRIAGRSRLELGEIEAAAAAYRRAVDELERYRGGVPPDEYMAAFLGGRSALYEEIVDLLVTAGDTAAAFEYTERAKARALADLMAGRHDRGPLGREGGPSARRVRYLRERLNAVYQQLLRREGESDVRAARFLRDTRERAREIEQEIAALLRRGGAEGAGAGATAGATDIASVRADLEPDTALIEYFVTSRAIYAFALTRDEVHVHRRETAPGALSELIRKFRTHLVRGERTRPELADLVLRATRANLGTLAEWLVRPFAPQLASMRRIVIVPHGELHQVPFHALPWTEPDGTAAGADVAARVPACSGAAVTADAVPENRWLSDRFEVVYAPSAAVYGFCRRVRPEATGEAAVFGLPDDIAPRIEDECRRVAQVLGSASLHLREEATFERLRRETGRARIVHIATHGMFRHEHPMLSTIRMADRWVNPYDLYGIEVKGELVVLSTCESGVANANGANEIQGLTRGFLYAGAPALLTSQWPVDDAVTCRFMERFHEALRDGEGAAAAHRRAMADVRSEHPHPFFWAPFFLTGRPVDARLPAPSGTAAPAADLPTGTSDTSLDAKAGAREPESSRAGPLSEGEKR